MIAALDAEHVSEVARLHCENLTGLLSQLGTRAARAYYLGCVGSRAAVGLVFIRDERLVGFALGSPSPAQLKNDVLRLNPRGTLGGILVGVLRRPAAGLHLLRSLSGPPEGSYDSRCAELIYLAVSGDARGAGVGRRLLEAFGRALRDHGVRTYELSVDEDNRSAIRFYEKAGFELVGQYREFGVKKLRLRLTLA